jgi:hypothetical protein
MLTEIEKLDALGREYGCVIYSVHQCQAGWGVQWYEGDDPECPEAARPYDGWRQRLVTYAYYPTITQMVEAEKRRLADTAAGLLRK